MLKSLYLVAAPSIQTENDHKKSLEILQEYDGNLDAWSRSFFAKKDQYKDWHLIESILQDIRLIESNLATEEYRLSLEQKIRESCENQEAIDALHAIGVARS